MNKDAVATGPGKFFIIAAALVIIIAGLKASQALLVPFLLSVFIAIIVGPVLSWLRNRGIPSWAALPILIVGLLIIGLLVGALLGSSMHDFSRSLPQYHENLKERLSFFSNILSRLGITVADQAFLEAVNPGVVMQFASKLLTGFGNILSNSFLILLTVIFILLESSTFQVKLRNAFNPSKTTLANLDRCLAEINRYMTIKTWISLGTGILVAVWLAVLGVDYPVLWGVLAFLFNYVPNIGSIIAAVPAVLLALIQLGASGAMLAAGGYIVLNVVIGNVIEPRFMGKGLGLSTLVVFLSLVFWGWVFGPVGMLLSIPLTMTVKIVMSSMEETKWLATILGQAAEKDQSP